MSRGRRQQRPYEQSGPLVPGCLTTRACNLKTENPKSFDLKLKWLLESSSGREVEELFIDAAISVKSNTRQVDGLPESLLLAHDKRLLLVPLGTEKEMAWLGPLLNGQVTLFGKNPVKVSMFEGALSAILIYGKTNLHSELLDLSEKTSVGEGKKVWKHIKDVLGSRNHSALQNLHTSSYEGKEENELPPYWKNLSQRALASYLISGNTVSSTSSAIKLSLRSKRELDFLAQSAAASHALRLLAPKHSKGDVSVAGQAANGDLFLTNNRFNARIKPNSEQTIHFKALSGESRIFRASEIVGRRSTLQEVTTGPRNRLGWNGEWEIRGKEDQSLAEIKTLEWMGNVVRLDTLHGGSAVPFDKSGFLNALLFNQIKHKQNRSSLFMSKGRSFSSLASARLNPSQKKAAEKILSSEPHRLVLIQGPPGTGKSNLIGEVAKQWKHWSLGNETIYAVCQSNLAVRNITSSLFRLQIDFRLVVSFDFKFEWHDHLYEEIQSKVIVTDELGNSFDYEREFSGVSIVLCTLASLSSDRLFDLFLLRPLHLLIVDEASQVLLANYPHLLNKFSKTLDRIAFIGDPEQLAPFGSESVPAAHSVFDLPSLKDEALFLDTSYRLPKELNSFISQKVYGGKLKSGDHVWQGPLSSFVRFIDVDKGREDRAGSSFKNTEEADIILEIIKNDFQGSGLDYKVITTYNGQRSLIENKMKRDR